MTNPLRGAQRAPILAALTLPLMGSLVMGAISSGSLRSQAINVPFNTVYSFTDLGTITGVPAPFGGLTFQYNNPNILLICGAANTANGAIYAVPVTRDGTGKVTGFGTPAQVASAPNGDGGLAYGPNNVLFYTRYPNHELGMFRPGSTTPDKIIDLSALGMTGSVGAFTITPSNFPGAGRVRLGSFNSNTVYGATLTPDGNGTFDLTNVSSGTLLAGGLEGLLYVPAGSPLFPDYQYILVGEYRAGTIAAYQIDGTTGAPLPATRTPFLSQVGGAEGAAIDPITGDFFFSTFGSGNRVLSVQGFGVCGEFELYGTGSPGLNGIPQIQGGGCAGRGQVADISVTNGRPGAAGWLNLGFTELSISVPAFNATILCDVQDAFAHVLDPNGEFTLPAVLPPSPTFAGFRACFQAAYIDAASPVGFSTSAGLRMIIR